MNTARTLGVVAAAAAALSPALMLSLRGGTGYCFFVILALSLVYLCNGKHRARAAQLYRRNRFWVWAMLGMPLIVFFQIVVLRTGTFPALDPLLRLALVVPCFFLLASLDVRQLRHVGWGFVAGALLAGAWVMYQLAHPNLAYGAVRVGNAFTNPIPFGDTALILGFMAFGALSRDGSAKWPEIAIRILALLAGGYASYASGARGGWIAVPFLLWAALAGRHWFVKARVPILCILIVCVAAVASTKVVDTRVEAIRSDLQAFYKGNSDTSVGVRFDLWRAAVRLYVHHPVLGVGRGRLESAMRSLVEQGKGPEMIINGRAHSEFFSVLAEMGTIGVIALLSLYAGTFRPFWRERHNPDPHIATAAYTGIMLIGSTVIFGLTIDVLTLVMNAAFFALTGATLLAWIEARKRELAEADRASAATVGARQEAYAGAALIASNRGRHDEKNVATDA
ncbi:O-antigen ligase family protein [Trinickia dinghuensis]|uniref:O-antigen ligase family protein n=1 Tax=Trinickia dinghuensis TaxID=2291023 RepID=A0A3D8JTR8_9BURK|nr:O-antigen ligase family protein [Trinickia dinghuensis]RDU96467.1 O-antigen ligase family protein [Trinickia dinghuensis]